MNKGIDEVTLARLRKEREESLARQEQAPGLFLEAWKKAVMLAGEHLFTVTTTTQHLLALMQPPINGSSSLTMKL